MGIGGFLARKGNIGGTARWAGKLYLSIKKKERNKNINEIIIRSKNIGIQKLLLWLLETTPVSLALMVPGFSIAVTAAGTFTLALIFRFYQLKKK